VVLPPGWWQQHAMALRRALEQSTTFDEACERIRRELGVSVSRDALRSGCMRAGLPTPSALLGVAVRARIIAEASTSFAPASTVLGVDDDDPPTLPSQRLPPSPYSATEPPAPMPRAKTLHDTRDAAAVGNAPPRDDVRRLLDATRRAPVPFADLCDLLDLSPRKCRELVEGAQQAGYAVSVDHGEVSFRLPEGGQEHVVDVAPATSGPHLVAVISDVHFGSKWCLRRQLRDFVEHAHARGVRHVLSPGDWLDGVYRHSLYEQSHRGFDEQAQDALESLPHLPGLTYHFIDGNHDDTLSDAIGMESGRALVERFAASGRHDLRFYGRRGAYLRLFGARIELWHPRSGKSYALSYQLQNHIRDYAVGQKPDVLLAGHWHIWTYFEQRGVHALACGTFQGGGSAYGRSLGGAPSMGGTLLSWELTDHGTIRRFAVERSAYYEQEHVREAG
jgi:predicted phosphodiesterase